MSCSQVCNSKCIELFIRNLTESGCTRCSLSEHENRIVVCRGNPHADIMIVGEAPGKIETQEGIAFVGPAGQLFVQIMKSIGVDMDRDVYLSNICRCRPVADPGEDKENYTPLAEQKKACMPYLMKEIELVDPKILIAAGRTAAISLFALPSNIKMKDIAGKQITHPGTGIFGKRKCFVLYHPAWILHQKKQGTEAVQKAKKLMWQHVQELKKVIEES